MCAEVTWNAEVSYIHLGSMAENLQFLSGKKKTLPQYQLPSVNFLPRSFKF